jgi:hypothetical protein
MKMASVIAGSRHHGTLMARKLEGAARPAIDPRITASAARSHDATRPARHPYRIWHYFLRADSSVVPLGLAQ